MNAHARRPVLPAIGTGIIAALQWRLMLLWILVTLLPTLVVALPLWRVLDQMLGHSAHADRWAAHFDGLVFGDVLGALSRDNTWTGMAFVAGALLTLAISPFLTGMVVAVGRAGRTLGFGGLLQGGGAEYGRMLRVLLLSLLPYGVFVGIASAASSVAEKKTDAALLQSTADAYGHGMLAIAIVVFILAQSVVEATRAQFIADAGLRSAWRALARGCMQLVRRPFATLSAYVVITLVGGALVVAIAAWRGHTVAVGSQWVVAFLIVQLGVAVVAWMRTARLLALAGVAPSRAAQRRHRNDFAPAL